MCRIWKLARLGPTNLRQPTDPVIRINEDTAWSKAENQRKRIEINN